MLDAPLVRLKRIVFREFTKDSFWANLERWASPWSVGIVVFL